MIINQKIFLNQLINSFPHTPTLTQESALKQLSEFVFLSSNDSIFVLKGFAGTGKTTTISALVNNLSKIRKQAILMAPTGRAAKVMSNYSQQKAFTIHKKIYFPKKNKSGGISFTLQINKYTNTIFIVDEASMIPDDSNNQLFDTNSLLNDLIQFVYSGTNCRLILIGDEAQLPPVKLVVSPALDVEKLEINYQKIIYESLLNEVVRQQKDSEILENATLLRSLLSNNYLNNFKFKTNSSDVFKIQDGFDLQEKIQNSYDDFGIDQTTIIVRSNKRANLYNQQVRNKIRGFNGDITVGDYIMVVKNNYYWLNAADETDFIANGDICEVLSIYNFKELYGFKFAEVKIRMIDYDNLPPFDTVILLDTLTSDAASLSYDDANKLYQEIALDYAHIKTKYKKLQSIKNDKYYNALQVKFSYAVTCHKSQGGQWKCVFIEQPYNASLEQIEYIRWLYTAITRAEEKLFLIGFNDSFYH
jgi:exodeoxyribonuclease-5